MHLAAAGAVIALALILRVSALDWACLLAVIGLVLTAEALNTVSYEIATRFGGRLPRSYLGVA